jgi:hypothetical protein
VSALLRSYRRSEHLLVSCPRKVPVWQRAFQSFSRQTLHLFVADEICHYLNMLTYNPGFYGTAHASFVLSSRGVLDYLVWTLVTRIWLLALFCRTVVRSYSARIQPFPPNVKFYLVLNSGSIFSLPTSHLCPHYVPRHRPSKIPRIMDNSEGQDAAIYLDRKSTIKSSIRSFCHNQPLIQVLQDIVKNYRSFGYVASFMEFLLVQRFANNEPSLA